VNGTNAEITVSANGYATVNVLYGPTTSFGETTITLPSWGESYFNLHDLSPNTTYYLQAIATPASGSPVDSEIISMTTGAAPAQGGGGNTGSGSTQGGSIPTPPLGPGSTGPSVTTLQELLKKLGYFPQAQTPTTYYGTITEKAVVTFESSEGLPQTGSVSTSTEALIQSLAGSSNISVTTTTTSITFTRTLYIGLSGSDVQALQKLLFQDGDYPQDIISGYFGSLTEAAVQRYQEKYGIVSNGSPATTGWGVVGPRTRERMEGR
jgi:peptidoglycan hydrolase-like protein with peptidoglycan-binding domain